MGLWALPVYGVALFIGTLSSQPEYHKDFRAMRANQHLNLPG
jgi:hypothetical protein